MLIVYKYQKPGAIFASLSEAMADFDSKLTVADKSTIDSVENNSITTGAISQPLSYELVGPDQIIQVMSASRFPTRTETAALITASTKRQDAGWVLKSIESDGVPLVVSNGRFYTNNQLIPYYPE